MPHLHVPMQSGDDDVLRGMGRHYTAEEYVERVRTVRVAAPAVNVTADVIVGFPTEDEAAFERTLAAIDAAGISRVHAFSYSPRPGTVASELGDRVPPEEKKRRSRVLRGHARSARAITGFRNSASASGCLSTRSRTCSAPGTRPITRAATSRPGRPSAAPSSTSCARSSKRTVCGARSAPSGILSLGAL